MNRRKCDLCPVCKGKLRVRSFEAPECPKCQTVFPNIFRQIQIDLDRESRATVSLIHPIHFEDELPGPVLTFEKLLESKTIEDLTFRCSRAHSNNVLSVEACKNIGLLLQQQTNLRRFAFECPAEHDGMPHIREGLTANQSLQEVELSFSSVYQAEQLGKGIAANTSIKNLKVSGNSLSATSVFHLFEELQTNQSLVELKLENTLIADGFLLGLQYLPPSISVKLSNIHLSSPAQAAIEGISHCKFSELEIGNTLEEGSIRPVLEGLALNRSIKKFVVYQDGRLHFDTMNLVDVLAKNNTLLEISMTSRIQHPLLYRQQYVDRVGFLVICEALTANTTLTSLDLSVCGIGGDLDDLSQALLSPNNKLKSINLSCNPLYASNLNKFCESLKVNTTLQTLNLARCHLTRNAMVNLSGALRVNRNLTEIDFSHHSEEFTVDSYNVLCDALKSNNLLKKVVIGTHYFNHKHNSFGLATVADLIKHNTSIVSLKIIEDVCLNTAPKCFKKFVEALKTNTTMTSLNLGPFMNEDKLANIFAVNYALIEADFSKGSQLSKFLKRNLDYRKSLIPDSVVLYENIFRSQEAMDLLPPELWMHIFACLTYPGIGSMASLVQKFLKYRI